MTRREEEEAEMESLSRSTGVVVELRGQICIQLEMLRKSRSTWEI